MFTNKMIKLIVIFFPLSILNSFCSYYKSEKDFLADVVTEPEIELITEEAPPAEYCAMKCTKDSDCWKNELFCDGIETCDLSNPDPLTGEGCCTETLSPCTEPEDKCKESVCIEETRSCIEMPRDEDKDGFPATKSPDGNECEGGSDCDDTDPAIHPGAEETCDGKDNDCDGVADENTWIGKEPPFRVSNENAVDGDLGEIDNGWCIAWVEKSNTESSLNLRYIGNTKPDAQKLNEANPSGEIELITIKNQNKVYIFWIEYEILIRGAEIVWNGNSFETQQMIDIYRGLNSVHDLEASALTTYTNAGLFFRSKTEGNDEIWMIPVNLSNFELSVDLMPVRVTRAVGFSGFPVSKGSENSYALVWEDEREGNKDVFFALLNQQGILVSTEIKLSYGPSNSRFPSITEINGEFLVAWMDDIAGPFNIFYLRIANNGIPISYPFSFPEPTIPKFYPSVAPDPRGESFENQASILFVTEEGNQKSIYLTEAGREIRNGGEESDSMEFSKIYSTTYSVTMPVLLNGEETKGLIWKEENYSEKILYFIEMECKK